VVPTGTGGASTIIKVRGLAGFGTWSISGPVGLDRLELA